MIKYFFLLLNILLFLSCKKSTRYSYIIKNNTPNSIKVIYKNLDISPKDSFILNSYSSKSFVVIWGERNSIVKNYNKSSFYLRDFEQLDIYKNDILKSKTNFLESNRWGYLELTKGLAEYNAIVEETDF
jgi:hypothetical protein